MFDDPVAYVIRGLLESLEDVSVGGRVPNPRPTEFVRCVFSGATFQSAVHRLARVTVECWSSTDASAERFAERVMAAVQELGDSWNDVLSPERWAGGPAAIPDPDSGSPRIVFTLTLFQRSR